MLQPDEFAAHDRPENEVLAALASSAGGLTSVEAEERRARFGPNELPRAVRMPAWRLLLAQFANVLILILLVATALSAALGHRVEAIAISVIVGFAVVLGFVQEYRAERALEALQRLAAPRATVVRDGREVQLPAREVVPGDVFVLAAGDHVPADGRLLFAANLQVEEAALTGESGAAAKVAGHTVDSAAAVADRKNMVFTGTAVARGRGRAVAVTTGAHTEFGKIATLLTTIEQGRTPLQVNLDRVGRQLARVSLVLVAGIVAVGVARGQPLVDMFVFGIALAVAVVPEALPAVVTISLALGVQRMARRNVLVRRLPAVETLGSTTVICSDKTGTLTRDQMTVRRMVLDGQILELTGVGYEPVGELLGSPEAGELGRALLRAAVLASDAVLAPPRGDASWTVQGDPTEGALVVAAQKLGLARADLEDGHPRVDEIPFTSESKRMTTLHTTPSGEVVAFAKGAPEVILSSCSRVRTLEGERPLDEARRGLVLAAAAALAASAQRVLAVAEKRPATREDAERDLVLLGLVGMIDPPRPEAAAAARRSRDAGIEVVMITGDHPITALAVAEELGLARRGKVLTGPEISRLADGELDREVEGVGVFARVSPEHKLRVVNALKRRGHVVAMTGDGVNDAPALRRADIGIAMGITGTDVSREAAAMTLTDDNFTSIVAAVEEGRAIYDNIKKYLMYLLSSNVGEMGLMAGAGLLGLPLPLTAVQILYVNLATDGLPALALSLDPPSDDLMSRKPRDPRLGIFTRPVVALILLGGLWSTVVNLALFQWARASGKTDAEAMTMTFVSLVLIQFFKAYNFRSDRRSVWVRPFANRWLNLAVGWELVLLVCLVYVPFLRVPFGTFPLTATDWGVVLGVALSVSPVLELGKAVERAGWMGPID
jgi:P-type Ca2+ transporter type 2C